jgi:hypothetical protein
MAFDIVLRFITPSAGSVTGFLTAEPITDGDIAQVTQARDAIQSRIGDLSYITIFSRDTSMILDGQNPTAFEITLPGEVLKNSVMLTQIIEVAA